MLDVEDGFCMQGDGYHKALNFRLGFLVSLD